MIKSQSTRSKREAKKSTPEEITRNQTLNETIDLRDWLRRCHSAGVPVIPAKVCPFEIKIDEILHRAAERTQGLEPQIEAISSWTEKMVNEAAKLTGKAMWRWSLCAPIEIKAAISHPGIPVRMPWPGEATDDERFLAILSECQEAGIKTVTTIARPWIQAVYENEFPVEFRVFVTAGGGTSTTSYYTQRPLSKKWLPHARKAARLAQSLRPHVAEGTEFSADFLVTKTGDILFLEGGPPPQFGGDPCCLDPTLPLGDGRIAFKK